VAIRAAGIVWRVGCPQPELCQDWVDNDQDGLVDCADSDCWNDIPCDSSFSFVCHAP
jgi:hypothetical protein